MIHESMNIVKKAETPKPGTPGGKPALLTIELINKTPKMNTLGFSI
jgi:hypothetical protein